MREIYRILDANFNRAREALRVAEDCGRFALNDPAITAMAKHMRGDLQEILTAMPAEAFVAARDTAGDLGTELTTPTESHRAGLPDVAVAACKRLSGALRSIEEYSKIIAPEHVTVIERMRYNAYTLEQRILSRLYVADRFAEVRLYVLISSGSCRHSIKDTARAAIAGGADAIQLREKQVPDGALLAMAAELRELTDETNRMLIINDRADIAALVSADGVHLGQHDLPSAEARKLLAPGAIIGRSTHNRAELQAAINEGADYIAAGPVFDTKTKDAGPLAGLEYLAEARQATRRPLIAIGGIDGSNAEAVAAAGADGVAVSAAICGADDPQAAAAEIRAAIDRGHQSRQATEPQ